MKGKIIGMGTRNIKSLRDKKQEVTEELQKPTLEYVGLTEIKRKKRGKNCPGGR